MLSVGLVIATAWAADEKSSSVNVFNIINAIVAVSALILSLLPPIKKMFKGKRLRQVVGRQIEFTYASLGLTYIYIWLDLGNNGGQAITIKRIKGFLFLGDKLLQPLTADTYVLTESLLSGTQRNLPIAEIPLKPDERWSRYIILWDSYSYTKDVETRIKNLLSKIKEDTTKKEKEKEMERNRQMTDTPIEKIPLIEVDPTLVNDALKIADELKKLKIGDYKLLICTYDDPEDKEDDKKPLGKLGFEFTLYPDQVNDIFADIDKDRYKCGYGLILPRQLLNTVPINIRPISKDRTQELLNRL